LLNIYDKVIVFFRVWQHIPLFAPIPINRNKYRVRCAVNNAQFTKPRELWVGQGYATAVRLSRKQLQNYFCKFRWSPEEYCIFV